MLGAASHRRFLAKSQGVVDTLGFFENQLIGGTYMTFDETILGVRVQAITTNFDGNPTNGSYIKVNGTLIAGDRFGTAPDGTNTTTAPFQMTRGHTITVLNPATGLSRSGFPKCWDTWNNIGIAAPPTAGLANDVKNAAVGDIIVIGTYDATALYQPMRDALTTYTGANTYTNTWSPQRISHMFLAKRRLTRYIGTIDSSVGNPFSFKVRKTDNLGMAAAVANSGWILTWTDPRFDNGGFTASQINVRTQTGAGFTSFASEDATFYNFTSWFGAAQLPQGTQFTIDW
jgi:hypothetical protein